MSLGKDFFELIGNIGYEFNDIAYIENALTHSSYANERKSRGISYPSNERLEFLGDAVLQILISEYLYENYKCHGEGALTKMRQYLVCEKTLSEIARGMSLGDYINLGRGEEITDCRNRPKVLADTLEAIVAAIYLDSDKFSKGNARSAVLMLFKDAIDGALSANNTDFKTMLQQLVEKDGMATLEYTVIDESGPEHDKTFTVEARVNNNRVGVGTARNKKDAEMQAARVALSLFGVSV